jgi:hypothetical protein
MCACKFALEKKKKKKNNVQSNFRLRLLKKVRNGRGKNYRKKLGNCKFQYFFFFFFFLLR